MRSCRFSLSIAFLVLGFQVFSLLAVFGQTNEANYRLAPNDTMDFRVFQEPDMDAVIRISNDGSAAFPLIGNCNIGGKTIPEAIQLLEARYREGYLKVPQVTLVMREYGPRRFTVLGQVKKAGSYLMAGSDQVTLLDAIGIAGGYSRIADPSKITIKRREGDTERVIKINAKKMANSDGDISFVIKPGDIITVGESLF